MPWPYCEAVDRHDRRLAIISKNQTYLHTGGSQPLSTWKNALIDDLTVERIVLDKKVETPTTKKQATP
jgi:hypothetical protein